MSLLDGLEDALVNPILEDALEARTDFELEFELALEAAVDKAIELSDDDINAILDDDNPDNVVADISAKDESVAKIANDAIPEEFKAIEAALDALNELSIATEGDDDYDEELPEPEMEEPEEDDDHIGLDSLLESIFDS